MLSISRNGLSRRNLLTLDAVCRASYTFSSAHFFIAHDTFYSGKNRPDWSLDISPDDSEDDDAQRAKEGVKLGKKYSPSTISTIKLFDERLIPYDLIIRVMEDICFGETYNAFSSAILIFMPGIGEIRRLNDMLGDHAAFSQEKQFRVYPLHSTLSNENQGAVFDIPPPGVRKIVIGVYSQDGEDVVYTGFQSDEYCRDWHNYSRYHMCHRHRKVQRDEVHLVPDCSA